MRLTKISDEFDIYLSDEKDLKENSPIYLNGNKVFYRFMNCLYIPEHVYKLSPTFVDELNNLREKYALSIIDKEFNDLVIGTALDFIKPLYSQKVNVLDFGCGYGYAGELIKNRFPSSALFGVDIKMPLAKQLFNSYDNFSIISSYANLPMDDAFFDIIVAFFVFHFYVTDLQIKELARIIKPGGILFLNLINSADFEVLNRLHKAGFVILREIEIVTAKNSGRGYFYCLADSII